MRILSSALCAAAILASSCLTAGATEVLTKSPGMTLAPETTTISGTITGANGLKLNCAGTTAEVHDNGKKLGEFPTTSNGAGGCKFDAKVTAPRMSAASLSSCAGKVSLAEESERLSLASSRTFNANSGHEKLGMLGKSSLYSTLGSGATPSFQVGAEQ